MKFIKPKYLASACNKLCNTVEGLGANIEVMNNATKMKNSEQV